MAALKWQPSPYPTPTLTQHPLLCQNSQTADSVSLPNCVRCSPLWLQAPCKRWHLLVHKATPSTSLGSLWSPQRKCTQQVEKWWACLVLCPEDKFTPGTLDTRSRQQTLARPDVISGEAIFHSTQLFRLLWTQDPGKSQHTHSRILQQTYGWAWGGW